MFKKIITAMSKSSAVESLDRTKKSEAVIIHNPVIKCRIKNIGIDVAENFEVFTQLSRNKKAVYTLNGELISLAAIIALCTAYSHINPHWFDFLFHQTVDTLSLHTSIWKTIKWNNKYHRCQFVSRQQ